MTTCANSVATHLARLEPDPWRQQTGFSAEVEAANHALFASTASDEVRMDVLNGWIRKHQPCLFGRMAAALKSLAYCVLSETDLRESDQFIRDKIQRMRLKWTHDGYDGKKSGFILLAVSPMIANARPGPAMLDLARRLCFLYLETEIATDTIHLDQIYLQKPGSRMTTWRWYAGVNYFCAQGDGRWWNDHRIPGGMAFSVNSVGHLVKSGQIANAMRALDEITGAPAEPYPETNVDSLDKALELAMRTIAMASNAVSGKATELLPMPDDPNSLSVPQCPVKLSPLVADKNYCEYQGRYHTDYTLPSEYFLPDIERPDHVGVHTLDLTYLFHKTLDNPDLRAMGEGHQIREHRVAGGDGVREEGAAASRLKFLKGMEEEVLIEDAPRLRDAMCH